MRDWEIGTFIALGIVPHRLLLSVIPSIFPATRNVKITRKWPFYLVDVCFVCVCSKGIYICCYFGSIMPSFFPDRWYKKKLEEKHAFVAVLLTSTSSVKFGNKISKSMTDTHLNFEQIVYWYTKNNGRLLIKTWCQNIRQRGIFFS